MTKTDFIEKLAEKAGLTKKDAAAAVNAYNELVAETLASGDKISMPGFGTFEVKARGERVGRNPKTKEAITIPASKSAAWKPSKTVKDALNAK